MDTAMTSEESPQRYEWGKHFTSHMVTAEWAAEDGWSRPAVRPFGNLSLSPAMVGLHYGQAVFEGLKAYRRDDGEIGVFRPTDHAVRFARSAQRLVMPEVPEGMFLDAVDLLVAADRTDLPDEPGLSMYLRPLLFASEANLALRPARRFGFLLLAFVTGGFFADVPDPVTVWVSRDHTRAIPGGTGAVKFAGNYAPTYLAQEQARHAGGQQVVWLDAVERRWVEELGGMNLFFVRGSGVGATLVTPPCAGTLLPGITRDSLIALSGKLGYAVAEEPVSVDQWRAECEDGTITETFACGTAAVVTPVGAVRDGVSSWQVGSGGAGPVALALRNALVDVHHGRAAAPEGWIRIVRGEPRRGPDPGLLTP